MPYRIEFTRAADRGLSEVPRNNQTRIARRIDVLADDPRPRGVRKLAGEGDLYRIRVGDYRVVYEIHEQVLLVLVIRVAHRRDVYR